MAAAPEYHRGTGKAGVGGAVMTKAQFIFSILVIGLIPVLAAGQTASVYKWVDGEGVINYGALPPDSVQAERTTVRIRGTDRNAIRAQEKANTQLTEATNIRKRQESGEEADATAERQQVAAQRAENCRLARERMTRYSEAHRLYRPGADGEREYLTSEEIDSERAEAINSVSKWCDNS
jgi:hypothetical protein